MSENIICSEIINKMNGHSLLNTVISTTDSCKLLLSCLDKAFHVCSATFTTENCECMVRLKKFSLEQVTTPLIVIN